MTRASVLLLLASMGTSLAAQTPGDRVARAVSEQAIRAHVEFLADDALEGRAPATRGGELAARYIAAQFQRLGLKPGGDSGSFLQRVPLVSRTSTGIGLEVSGDTASFRPITDYVLWSETADSMSEVVDSPVFVGFGIVAPVYGWDDYKGAQVRGRLVIALAGDPDSTIFDRHTGMPYGGWRYKVDEAMRHGASGILLIHTTRFTPFAWGNTIGFAHELTAIEKPIPSVRIEGWLSEAAAQRIIAGQARNLDSLIATATHREFRSVPLSVRLGLRVATRIRRWETQNVVGLLPGTGPLAKQAVVIGAHYDHLGIREPVDGDSIYNGAEDNASGTACVLAAAEAFRWSGTTANRSIFFVAFGAEERGLLGSQGFVARQRGRTVVGMVNMDVMNLWGRSRDIGTVAPDHSTLGAALDRAAKAESLKVNVDPDDVRRGRLFRSDNFSFMQVGIPAIRLLSGLDYEGRPPEWGREQKEAMWETRYHTPSDDVKLWYTMDGTAQQVRVLVRMTLDIANAPNPPRWAPDSPFNPQGRPGKR
ncbi:MAG TPA: M20/M25/M40 family metallo-hydrolase [Gemmatimonadales bacterium]|nr:M20/M25/M40 family metallo-hydrolase [Gemmatimonadales bacterium]